MSFRKGIKPPRWGWVHAIALFGIIAMRGGPTALAADPAGESIEVVRPPKEKEVDFELQVKSALRANCLPCHNKTVSKADLILETPADMLKGGENGTALIPGKAETSPVFRLAAHLEKPRMPPRGNKVNAVDLTPEQLGWLAEWIDRGAKPSPKREEQLAWQPLPSSVQPILALGVSENGRYAVCGRGNQMDVYQLGSGEHLGSLVDPVLSESNHLAIAHRDEVNAVAISPDGEWIASGGYREIKIWRRSFPRAPASDLLSASPVSGTHSQASEGAPASKEESHPELVIDSGHAVWRRADTNAPGVEYSKDWVAIEAAAAAERIENRWSVQRKFREERVAAAGKDDEAQRERLKKAAEGLVTAAKPWMEKETALIQAREHRIEAEAAVATAVAAKGDVEAKKAADNKLKEASQAVEKAEEELKTVTQKRDGARNELELAGQSVQRAEAAVQSAQKDLETTSATLAKAQETRKKAAELASHPVPTAVAAAFTKDRRQVVTIHTDQCLRIWNATNGLPLETIPCGFGLQALIIDRPGWARVQTDNGEWQEVALHPVWKLTARSGSDAGASPYPDRITALAFRPDGGLLAAGGGEPSRRGEITLIDPGTGNVVTNFPTVHSDTILSLAFSPDGEWLASGGADRFARIMESPGGRPLHNLEGHTGHVLAVAWSPDGRTLATGSADLTVKLWDPVTGEKRKQGGGFSREVTALTFLSEPGRVAAASGEGILRVLNEKVEKVSDLPNANDFTYALGMAGDRTLLLAGGQDGILRAWDVAHNVLAWQTDPILIR